MLLSWNDFALYVKELASGCTRTLETLESKHININHRFKRASCQILYPFEVNRPCEFNDVFSIIVYRNLCFQVFAKCCHNKTRLKHT